MEKISKSDANEKIEEFFKNIENKKPREIVKIKKLAMRNNIKLGNKRKLFCKKCYSVFNSKNAEIRIKNKRKIIKCKKCGDIGRFKLKK